MLRIVGVEPPQPGCQPSVLELKTSTMQIVRLPLNYAGNFEEVVNRNRLYTLGMYTQSRLHHTSPPKSSLLHRLSQCFLTKYKGSPEQERI